MKEIAAKMEKVDEEFQRRDLTILKLDQRLRDAKNVAQSLSKALRQAEISLEDKSQKIAHLQGIHEQQRQALDNQELKEFLHAENQALNETLNDAENEIQRLQQLLAQKDEELGKSEEQCRYLVRINEQRHQEILFITSGINALEAKAKDLILGQVGSSGTTKMRLIKSNGAKRGCFSQIDDANTKLTDPNAQ